jgi:hypothetical protein
MPDNPFEKAFKQAGYINPLDQIALDAWARNGLDTPEGGAVRRAYVEDELKRLPGAFAIEMYDRWNAPAKVMAIGKLLNEGRQLLRAAAPGSKAGEPAGGGQSAIDTQYAPAPASPQNAGQPAGDGHKSHDTHLPIAVAPDSEDAAMEASAAAHILGKLGHRAMVEAMDRKRQRELEIGGNLIEHKFCPLIEIKIGKKSIGDCRVWEVKRWAAKRQEAGRLQLRDARFGLALAATLDDDAIIRHHYNEEMARELYQDAAREMENAT